MGLMDLGRMSPIRSLAERLLRAMLRHAPEEQRAWVEAMLRELDFVETEWGALFWALGCTTAIFRECLRGWGAWITNWIKRQLTDSLRFTSTEEGQKMNSTGKKTLEVLLGMFLALALGVGGYFLRHVIADMLLAVGIPRTMWSHLLSVALPAEVILVVAAIILWRRKLAPVAVGLLVTGFVMAGHIVVSLVMH